MKNRGKLVPEIFSPPKKCFDVMLLLLLPRKSRYFQPIFVTRVTMTKLFLFTISRWGSIFGRTRRERFRERRKKTCDRKSKKDSDKCLVFPEKKRDFAIFLTSTTFLFNAYPPESNEYQWIKFLPNMIEKNAKNCSEFQKSCPISISMCYQCFNKCLELF